MNIEEIKTLSVNLVEILENINGAPPYGACHLIAYILAEILNAENIESRSVTGHLTLLDKKGKKILYSSKNPSNPRNVGYYHTWCEAVIDNNIYIIDPSLILNIQFLKNHYKIKVHPKTPDFIFTTDLKTYYWNYTEDVTLKKLSDLELFQTPTSILENLKFIYGI